MYRIRLLLGFAWIPVLSSCMMMGGTGDAGGMHSGQIHSALQQREASNGALTIVLSFPAPNGGATVPIDARFRTESEHHELTDADIWLRIHTPEGTIDEIPMHRVHSTAAGTYQAQYSFRAVGRGERRALFQPGVRHEPRACDISARP